MNFLSQHLQKVAINFPNFLSFVILSGAATLYFMDYSYLLITGIHFLLGVLGYLSILFCMGMGRDENLESRSAIIKADHLFRGLTAIYISIFAISTLLISFISVRTIIYFILIGILYLIIVWQITLLSEVGLKGGLILFELILVHLNFVYSFSLKYYYSFNRVDVLTHVRHTMSLVKTGKISAITGIYERFPMWHILSSVQHMIITPEWEIWKTLFIIGGVTGMVTVLGSYSLTNRILADRETPLYVALFVSVNPTIVFYSSYAIPRSAIVLFVVIILLLYVIQKDFRSKILLLVIITSIIFYHPATPPFLLVVLIAISGIGYLYNQSTYFKIDIRSRIFIITFVLTLVYWVYRSDLLIAVLAGRIVNSTPGGPIRTLHPETSLIQVFDSLYYAPVLTLILLGIRRITEDWEKLSNQMVVFSTIGIVSFFLAVPGPLSLITKFLQDFSFTRINMYTYIFILLLASFGFSNVIASDKRKIRIIGIGLLLVLLIPAIFGSLTAPDNAVTDTNQRTGYLTESEVTAFDDIVGLSNQKIYTDFVTWSYFLASPHSDRVQLLEYDQINHNEDDHKGIIIYRQAHASERSIQLDDPQGRRVRVTATDLDRSKSRYNKIYATKTVVALE